ncbi:MAG: hypothetical protein K2Q18_06360 [Bdellovibrionales bacterium]|nr:hypothetical protein [Bdellovibrionales bacterium]
MANSPDFEFNDELKKSFQSEDFLHQMEMDVIKYLRGTKSQEYMNQKLDFSFNQYAKWENGTKKVLWSDIVNIARIQKLNLNKGFIKRFIVASAGTEKSGPMIVQSFYNSFFNGDIKEFAKYLGITVPRMRRILKDTNTSFNIMLRLFIYRPMNLIYFLKECNIIQHFPYVDQDSKKLESFEQLEAKYPFASSVLYFTGTTAYKQSPAHCNKFVAKNLGLSLAQVELSMRELLAINLLSPKGLHYTLNERANELNTLSRAERLKVVHYWNYRASNYLQRKIEAPDDSAYSTKNIIGFRVYLTTKKVGDTIDELLMNTFHKVGQLLKESTEWPDDEVIMKVLTLQSFALDECPIFDFKLDKEMGLIKEAP